MQVLLQFGDRYLAKVEHTGCQCGIGMSVAEGVAEVFLGARASRGDDGNRQVSRQFVECFAGSVFHFGEIKIKELKQYLHDEGIAVRNR